MVFWINNGIPDCFHNAGVEEVDDSDGQKITFMQPGDSQILIVYACSLDELRMEVNDACRRRISYKRLRTTEIERIHIDSKGYV